MPLRARHDGIWRDTHSGFVRVAGVWQRVRFVHARDTTGVWRIIYEDVFTFTISGSNNDVNLRSAAIAAGWNQTATVQCTIASGAVLNGSGSTGALVINGDFPRGVTLINDGTIAGRAGNGGVGGAGRGDQGDIVDSFGRRGGVAYGGSSGAAGQRGLLVQVPVTIFNNGSIAGGGGGGGGGGATIANKIYVEQGKGQDLIYLLRQAAAGGGGGGAGRSNNFGNSGGAGGIRVRGSTQSTGGGLTITNAAAGGGSNLGGQGGGGSRGEEIDPGDVHARGGNGGSGGFWGASGGAGAGSDYWFPNNNQRTAGGGAAGAGGPAVTGSNNITWGATGNRYGAIQA